MPAMSLDFAEFAHHYDGMDLNDAEQRAHFEVMADLLECIARVFWNEGSSNRLGISFDGDSLHIGTELASESSATTYAFNNASIGEATRKKDS